MLLLPLLLTGALPISISLPPPRLRTCCAFGYDLKTAVAGDLLPTVVANTAAYYDLGHHAYLQPIETPEKNGIIYTCRGGFVDISHVRDNADWTRYLFNEIRPVLGSSVTITLPAEGATKTLRLKSTDVPADSAEKDSLALQLAARIVYDLSIWHELATWWDVRSVPIFDERISAFSPEDMYSNMVGINVGMAALQSGKPYEQAVDETITHTLAELQALTPEGTRHAFNVVDGTWWDSTKAVPDVRLVTRRRIATETRLLPWSLPSARVEDCRHRNGAAAPQEVPTTDAQGNALAQMYEIQLEVDHAMMSRLPQPDGKRITNRELPWLTARAGEEIRALLGPIADREEITAEELKSVEPDLPCGAHDRDCSLTRKIRQNGTKLFKVELGTWSLISFIGGVTVADFVTRGGSLQLIDYRSAVEWVTGKYLMRAEALRTTGILSGCRKLKPDASGETYVPLGFVNPVDEECLPGSAWGIKLDLLDLIYDGRAGVFGLRPAELGFGWNILGNGFSGDYLERRLIWSVNALPELYAAPNARSIADFVLNTHLHWHQSLWQSRLTLGGDAQVSWGTTRTSAVVEAIVRISYNQLLTFGKGHDRAHTMLSFGLEGGIDWWATRAHGIAPLNHRSIQLLDPIGAKDFYGVANLFVELSLPMIAI